MRRVVSLWLPTFPTDRLRRQWKRAGQSALPLEAPLVLAEAAGGKREIVALDQAARDRGLRVGMALASARALDSDLTVVDADRQADAIALERLAVWALRYTPLAAVDPSDGLWLDIGGSAHLFGGELAMLRRVTARIAAMGFVVRGAVADTPGAAHAVARFGGGGVVPVGAVAETLRDLPIAGLQLTPNIVEGLQGLGFVRIGQLVDTPRAPLARRFGAALLHRLDQVLGISPERPLQPVTAPAMPRCHRVLLEPIATAESLSQVTVDLTSDLCRTLEKGGQGVRRLDLVFHRVDGARLGLRVGTAVASRDAGHLSRLLIERIETIEPGLGIEAMELAAPLTQPLVASQPDMGCADARRGPDLASLVDRLVNRLGVSRVWRSRPVESHIPERSVAKLQPLAPDCHAAWPEDLPRPPLLIGNPEKLVAFAELPDHPPALFTWRGRRYRVRHGDGPERIHAEWWVGDDPFGVRDYFQVEVDDGSRFWLFRAGDGVFSQTGTMDWYLHGAFA